MDLRTRQELLALPGELVAAPDQLFLGVARLA